MLKTEPLIAEGQGKSNYAHAEGSFARGEAGIMGALGVLFQPFMAGWRLDAEVEGCQWQEEGLSVP